VKPFRELSRRARLYRTRILAETALEVYGLNGAQLRFLQYTANIIYRVDLPGSDVCAPSPYLPNRYVLRLHAIDDEAAIASELTWLTALNREAGLPVPAPVATPEGHLLAKIVTDEIPQGRIVSLMRWLDGRRLGKSLQPRHLKSLGQVVARLHDFSAAWQPPADFERFTWDWDSQLGGSMFKQPREELVESMPAKFRESFGQVSRTAQQAMEALGKGSDAFGLIHADLYPENVLYRNGQACPIDFEDCGYGYWLWDIAVALCEWAWKPDWERMRDAFHDGYAQIRTLPEAQWNLLDLFVATQFATMLLWASAFLKDDPGRADQHVPWRNESGEKLLRYFDRDEPGRSKHQ
jgi:Ser/Thr protein kinase RdoA (MazF antagonist)